jgi:hypothetical protein
MSPATNFGLPRDDAFLQAKTDADSVYPLRAKLVRAGALYETVSATAPANTNHPRYEDFRLRARAP